MIWPSYLKLLWQGSPRNCTRPSCPNLAPTISLLYPLPSLALVYPTYIGNKALWLPLGPFLEVSNGYSADSHLLHCTMEQARLDLGIATPFFQADYTQYGFFLTNCWVEFLWSFLTYAKFSLHTETPPDLGLQQVNDQFFMDTFLSIGQRSNSDLLSIN